MKISTELQNRKSKIESKRKQLELLISKRERLSFEILQLKKSLKSESSKIAKESMALAGKTITDTKNPIVALESLKIGETTSPLTLEAVDPELNTWIQDLDLELIKVENLL